MVPANRSVSPLIYKTLDSKGEPSQGFRTLFLQEAIRSGILSLSGDQCGTRRCDDRLGRRTVREIFGHTSARSMMGSNTTDGASVHHYLLPNVKGLRSYGLLPARLRERPLLPRRLGLRGLPRQKRSVAGRGACVLPGISNAVGCRRRHAQRESPARDVGQGGRPVRRAQRVHSGQVHRGRVPRGEAGREAQLRAPGPARTIVPVTSRCTPAGWPSRREFSRCSRRGGACVTCPEGRRRWPLCPADAPLHRPLRAFRPGRDGRVPRRTPGDRDDADREGRHPSLQVVRDIRVAMEAFACGYRSLPPAWGRWRRS